jgi:hypothetical protein
LPASTEVRLARAIRPFPVPRLLRALSRVHELASDLAVETGRALDPQPVEVIQWRQSLGYVSNALEAMDAAVSEARTVCMSLFDSAERDYDVAIRAALAMLDGLREGAQEPANAV